MREIKETRGEFNETADTLIDSLLPALAVTSEGPRVTVLQAKSLKAKVNGSRYGGFL